MIIQNRHFPTDSARTAFFNGFHSKSVEIAEMGFNSARNKLNMDVPPGKPFPSDLSEDGKWFCMGEAEALSEKLPR